MNTLKNIKRVGMHVTSIMYTVQNPFFREPKFPPLNT